MRDKHIALGDSLCSHMISNLSYVSIAIVGARWYAQIVINRPVPGRAGAAGGAAPPQLIIARFNV